MRQIPDWVRKELERRADKECSSCWGCGVVTYTARNISGEDECACECVERQMAKASR